MEVADRQAHALYERELRGHLQWQYHDDLGLSPEVTAKSIDQRLERTRGRRLAATLDEQVGLAGKRMLDVGSGWGELLLESLARGADAEGIEPDPTEVRISELLLRSYGQEQRVRQGRGESLPFPAETFELVTCQQVLEHVDDIDRVVHEMVRVTRPGGTIVVSVPNYLFPYEGHYRVKWFPLLPKRIGKHVLRALGRDPSFLLEHVNYTTYPKMVRLWRRHGLRARNLTEEFEAAGRHRHPFFRSRLWRWVFRPLKLYPNVTFLLEKPVAAGQPAAVTSRQLGEQPGDRAGQAAA